jgi:hypothetical protein
MSEAWEEVSASIIQKCSLKAACIMRKVEFMIIFFGMTVNSVAKEVALSLEQESATEGSLERPP